ncbi:hypothetical protein [Tabrizicola sp.]|uniref:hypothetical protein n=1 Tax=Tabrizicola sp. TaxID=2005166 RepID=UPI00286A4A1D|nr:hypothetical protein [Tabrizicola sp.]
MAAIAAAAPSQVLTEGQLNGTPDNHKPKVEGGIYVSDFPNAYLKQSGARWSGPAFISTATFVGVSIKC